MKKDTLYEILEVSENASAEVIEKAYKVLVKKYHPDLQEEAEKQTAEKKIKQINEAYEILGDETKRKEYDLKLEQEREIQKNNYEQSVRHTQNNQDKYTNNISDDYKTDNVNGQVNYNYENERIKYEERLMQEEYEKRKQMQEDLNREYENAYYNYLRSLGYKIKYKWTKENVKDFIIVIAIMIIIIIILWLFPPTHNWMMNFYEQNPILKTIINIIIGIIKEIFVGIWNFITGIFK